MTSRRFSIATDLMQKISLYPSGFTHAQAVDRFRDRLVAFARETKRNMSPEQLSEGMELLPIITSAGEVGIVGVIGRQGPRFRVIESRLLYLYPKCRGLRNFREALDTLILNFAGLGFQKVEIWSGERGRAFIEQRLGLNPELIVYRSPMLPLIQEVHDKQQAQKAGN